MNIYLVWFKRFFISFSYLLIFSLTLASLPCAAENKIDILSPEERRWLIMQNGGIIIDRAKENYWVPIEGIDENGNPYGIAIDYYKLIEKKLGFRFTVDEPRRWNERFERFKTKKIDVVNNLQKNSERSEYLLFTEPFIEIPNVIITRKEIAKSLTLDQMMGLKVCVTKDFAIHDYLKSNYRYLNINAVNNDLTALQQVSLKRADAAVVNVAVASYLIEKHGLTNLLIAGDSGYSNALCIASRKDWPILNTILSKGISLITSEEKKAIRSKWIHLDWVPFYKDTVFQIIVAFLLFILGLNYFWNSRLRKENYERKLAEKERERLIGKLQKALDDIKTLKGMIPICSSCKKIRDDKGYWNLLESYIEKHSEASFSHGMCPECSDELYGEEDWYIEMKKEKNKKI